MDENKNFVNEFNSQIRKLKTNSEQLSDENRKFSSQNMLLAIGGIDDKDYLCIEQFCPKLNSWSNLRTHFGRVACFAVACLDNTHVYVIGGSRKGIISNEVRLFISFVIQMPLLMNLCGTTSLFHLIIRFIACQWKQWNLHK